MKKKSIKKFELEKITIVEFSSLKKIKGGTGVLGNTGDDPDCEDKQKTSTDGTKTTL